MLLFACLVLNEPLVKALEWQAFGHISRPVLGTDLGEIEIPSNWETGRLLVVYLPGNRSTFAEKLYPLN